MIESNEPFKYEVPLFLQAQISDSSNAKLENPNSAKASSHTGEIFDDIFTGKDTSEIIIYPADLEENVLKPIYILIINYLESILQGADDSVEAIVLMGELCRSVYLMELIEDICKRAGTKCIYPSHREYEMYNLRNLALNGAVIKSLDNLKGGDYIPKIELNEKSVNSTGDDLHEIFLFIGKCSSQCKHDK